MWAQVLVGRISKKQQASRYIVKGEPMRFAVSGDARREGERRTRDAS